MVIVMLGKGACHRKLLLIRGHHSDDQIGQLRECDLIVEFSSPRSGSKRHLREAFFNPSFSFGMVWRKWTYLAPNQVAKARAAGPVI